ncbi:hypothetical protein E1A91_A02G078800v1 [Gossypium mustelinum]|uniref:Pentatricopeptide repeat-containing protein n=2 Tax=Gossypium TaxID=3633 RepID=A0A5D3A453_GOSMU|nr:hypothetical protein ES332_A02G085600v1 [Gossypium tomentosum]TYJ45761.1 hypothetical protein E1A91_A02G078800v1 [Gossypium mustelinum]TYJ45762.1 hypothetical protein E1A91_A02G078800v1 [Gossypium mustelinum]
MRPFLKPIYWSQKPTLSHCNNLINHCLSFNSIKFAQTIHAQLIKFGFSGTTFLGNRFVDLYLKVGSFHDVSKVFEEINDKNVISWNIRLNGLLKFGHFKKACSLFDEMPEKDVVSWNSMISGCGLLGFWDHGLEVFKQMQNFGVRPTMQVFSEMHVKDLISWNTLIMGLAHNGRAVETLELFKELLREGLALDRITLSGILLACRCGGFVDVGMSIFSSMEEEFGVTPRDEHYACVIDMLCHAGKFKEAFDTLETMPFEPSFLVWKSLALATMTYTNLNITETIAKKMIEQKPQSSLPYSVLNHAYEMSGKWEGIIRVKKAMKQRLKKTVGCSWIGTKKHVFMFEADRLQHKGGKDIYLILELLTWELEENSSIHVELEIEGAEG